jgi:diguanylate cyclase (GGDEF)-like protein
MSEQRRLEDREISILAVEAGPGPVAAASDTGHSRPPIVRHTVHGDLDITSVRPGEPGWRLAASAVLLDIAGEGEAVLVTGAEFRAISRGTGAHDLLARAVVGAAAWRRERARALRRMQLPDRLLAFSEELNRAQSVPAVCGALIDHMTRVVGGYTAAVYLHMPARGVESSLRPADHPWLGRTLRTTSLDADLRFVGPGLVRLEEVLPATGSPFSNLAPLFRETDAKTIAYVPLGDRGLVLLVERRAHRVFEAEDWDLLRSLTRQAEVALERVSLFERVHDLSLTDPLTGLGNRRKLEVVLEHAFAAARRGQPLSVVMIDVDGFKEFNDVHGHIHGDEVLRSFGSCLQEQVRGSDIVVRYGGDEFLFVLSGADAESARSTIERVRQNLPHELQFTAGIAEYDASIESIDQLIDRADRALYATRREDRRPHRRLRAAPAEG